MTGELKNLKNDKHNYTYENIFLLYGKHFIVDITSRHPLLQQLTARHFFPETAPARKKK
jgi:hypothetical protein